jgi:peptide/nickel transport system permease protein
MTVVKRIATSIVLVWVVTTIIFFLVHLMPGNPYELMLEQLLKQGYTLTEAYNQVRALFNVNLHEPLIVQYIQYITALAHGQLGKSTMYPGQSVAMLILQALPWTVFVVATALLISFGIGVVLGAMAAYLRGTVLDSLVTFLSSLLNGIPAYLTALVLFYFLAIIVGAFPMGGAYNPTVTPGLNLPFVVSVLHHAVLPILSFVMASFAGWALGMKASTISVLGEDFITAAKAMAVREQDILLAYVSRNAILPMFTNLVLSIGFMFSGTIFVEQVFNYPGIGYLFYQSTSARDYPLMEGCLLLLTTAVIFSNLAADLLYSRLDPRIKG